MISEDAIILGPEWHCSEEGIKLLYKNGTTKDRTTMLNAALDTDLKAIGKPFLATELTQKRTSKCVLQVQKIRNISAPKANENSQAAPRMLKLTLTDGESYIQAIESSPISAISRDKTAPGTKLLISAAPIVSGYLLLSPSSCTVLGGQVPHLHEKWLLAKSVQESQKYGRKSSLEGAPPWVNFGTKMTDDTQPKPFKSLDKEKPLSKEDSEFELQRQEAIAEATSSSSRKTFSGRAKQNVQPQFKKLMEPHERPRKGRQMTPRDEAQEKPQKPLEKVSLFDFLESKLPANEAKPQSRGNHQNVGEKLRFNGSAPHYVDNTRKSNDSEPKVETGTGRPNNNHRHAGNRSSFNKNMSNMESASARSSATRDIENIANNVARMSLRGNGEFAKRSLRQHLNLRPDNENNTRPGSLAIGSACMARYWEDGKFYNASVIGVTDATYVVKFSGYGNIEEVLKADCFSPTPSRGVVKDYQPYGSVEYRGRPAHK
ncbi:tudor domain-containing protein 3-like [Cylas formicarius]|uniref:tudor domain-containing protein 3-like n=1 Tax=Cylas formicarius TaxID=197179 RepID=UPI002958AAE2|nr:tudor domain-containing protein 3-like [Cylas formicarius]